MIGWFTYNKYPQFWKDYSSKFKEKQLKSMETTRFIIFDTETTGLHPLTDKILSIGAISIKNNTINVADSFEVYLNQDDFNADTVEIHGILKEGNLEKISEQDAIEKFINYIGNSVLIAHHAAFDLEMINTALKRLKLPNLKNKSIDTGILYKKLNSEKDRHSSLDVLCDEFNIPKHDRHTASGDAFITALLFLKIVSKLKLERTLRFSDLFRDKDKNGLI